MKEVIQELIEALRHELQQYGEMLARLDQQQDTVLRRDSAGVLDGVAAIESQGGALEAARQRRERARAAVASRLEMAPDATFADLVPALPEDYRPLVRALFEENNELLVRVRARSRQNHLLLSRTVELMQRLLGTLFANKGTSTYGGDGAMIGNGVRSRSLYEAVG